MIRQAAVVPSIGPTGTEANVKPQQGRRQANTGQQGHSQKAQLARRRSSPPGLGDTLAPGTERTGTL